MKKQQKNQYNNNISQIIKNKTLFGDNGEIIIFLKFILV